MHGASIESTSLDYAAYAHHGQFGTLAGSLQYHAVGKVDKTDTLGNPDGSLSPSDSALTVGYAKNVRGYGLGLSGKFIQTKLADSAQTLALDGGVLTPSFWGDRLRAGASFSNLGGKIKYSDESEDLPTTFRAGLEARPWKG